jgi:MFS family permease
MVVHMMPLLRDAGLALPQAAGIASPIGVGVILGRVLIGWAIDRIFAPYIACLVFIATACGCVLLNLGGAQAAPVAAFLIGFALGAEIDLIAYLTVRDFGLRNCGFIYGSIYSMFSIGAAAGPAIVGKMFEQRQLCTLGDGSVLRVRRGGDDDVAAICQKTVAYIHARLLDRGRT